MSSPVSPRRRRYRGSGELASRRGSPVSREAAFPQGWQSCDVDSSEPLRLRHLPYPRYRAAEEDIARLPTSQYSQPSAINSKPFQNPSVFPAEKLSFLLTCSAREQRRTLRVCPTSYLFYFSRQRILIKRNGIQCRKALDAV